MSIRKKVQKMIFSSFRWQKTITQKREKNDFIRNRSKKRKIYTAEFYFLLLSNKMINVTE